jgi:hypothetical protein
MLPSSPSDAHPFRRVGVGIDTARYGHYAAFLGDDLQPVAAELPFAESAAGYAQLRQRLEQIQRRRGPVQLCIRLDAAGQYADNLLHFLHTLATTGADATRLAQTTADATRLVVSISCGDPQRNKNYRAALFGNKKSDPIEDRACARFAVGERPAHTPPLPVELRTLRHLAGRLQAVVRHRTRLINQFHHLLALAFPELALLLQDIAAGWVLELVHRYPTAQLLATATPEDLAAIPYLPHKHIDALLAHAHASVASQSGAAIEELVRDQVRQLRDGTARQKRRRQERLKCLVHSPPHLARRACNCKPKWTSNTDDVSERLLSRPGAAWKGLAVGCLVFCLVLPALRSLRAVVQSWRRERWVRGESLPAWTKEPAPAVRRLDRAHRPPGKNCNQNLVRDNKT